MLPLIFNLDKMCKHYQDVITGFKYNPNNFLLKEIKKSENDIINIVSEINNLIDCNRYSLIDYNYFIVVLEHYKLQFLHTKKENVMDIFKRAEEFNADYHEMQTGYIYHIQEYNRAKKLGLPTVGIRVTDTDGNEIGYCREPQST